ncbi:hypothetical protein GGR58DRAFT_499592 [Xylaria digitata]|nr:hypothetical protein GGR58DRAFT_499592 [Xylaria digitata]
MEPNAVSAPNPPGGAWPGYFAPLPHDFHVLVLSAALLLSVMILAGHTYVKSKSKDINETDSILLILIVSMASVLYYSKTGHYGKALILTVKILYSVSTAMAKVVVLQWLERRFLNLQHGPIFLKTWWVWAGVFLLSTLSLTFSRILGLNLELHVGKTLAIFLSYNGLYSASDLVFLFYPTIALWNRKLNRREKFGVAAVFGVGILAIAADVILLRCDVQIYQYLDSDILSSVEPAITIAFMTLAAAFCVGCWPRLSTYLAIHFPIPQDKDVSYTFKSGHYNPTGQGRILEIKGQSVYMEIIT